MKQQEEYMIFEKRIDGIINEKKETDKMMEGEITKNSKQDATVTRNSEIRIGIKDWYAPVS